MADGYLFNLDEYDQNLVKNIKLKEGETIFRYFNEISAIGGFVMFIKINVNKLKAYFLKSEAMSEGSIEFETKGIDLFWINLLHRKSTKDKMAEGGEVEKSNFGKAGTGFDNPMYENLYKGKFDQRGVALKPTKDIKTLGSKVVITRDKNKYAWNIILADGSNYMSKSGFVTQQDAVNDYMKSNYSKGGDIKHKMAKGGVIVTSIKDIPNFKKRLEEGKITYRGLGLGKVYKDFYKAAGTGGVRIKVDGKEYFITDKEFDTFSRNSEGKMAIKFDAPQRKYEDGGMMEKGGSVGSSLNYTIGGL
jgi:hypothetical protein